MMAENEKIDFWYSYGMKKKSWYIFSGVLLVLALVVGYYAISPLFRNIKIDEAIPGEEQAEEAVQEETITPAQVIGTTGHPASGTALIVKVPGAAYIRYENFKTINGPDLYVYLAKDTDAKDFVNLGRVKATEGNINYEIPPGVDLAEYRYVLTWCKAFGVLFNSADIGATRP